MAHYEIDFPDDLLSEVLECDFDEIAREALEEAVPILEDALKKECRRVIEHPGESELVNDIKAYKPKKNKSGWTVSVKFSGQSRKKKFKRTSKSAGSGGYVESVRRYPVTNYIKAEWKEYGIPGRQRARPFITKACNNARDRVISKMQEVYNQKVGGR